MELAARDGRRRSLPDQARAVALVLAEEFGCPFAVYLIAGGEPVVAGPEEGLAPLRLSPAEVAERSADGRARADQVAPTSYRLSLVLSHANQPALLAVGLVEALSPDAREAERLARWGQAVADRLRLNDQLFERQRGEAALTGPAPAGPAWEALLTVDHLIRRLRIHKEAERQQQRILEGAMSGVPARALAWVPRAAAVPVVLVGEPCLAPADARHLATCLTREAEGRAAEPLFVADVAAMPWGARFPGVANLLAFPTAEPAASGWVIALNKKTAPSAAPTAFRRSDAALLTPFVALLELHSRAAQRYQDLKDLLVGLTRSLTAALDAKDSYTYGHSERVARIAVELGRELGLGADDLNDIYLAGLLHDVGKIGIRDAILLKPGPLTPEEFEHIKQHVTIGYTILADLHAIRNLLPGVLWHHERWDGKGYPDGLVGESIPLLARILAVADSYDAMSTARPYREALPFRRVEEILTEGAGSQWDARVIEAFQRCRQKVHAIRQRGVGESLLAAIDGALRSVDGSRGWPIGTPAG